MVCWYPIAIGQYLTHTAWSLHQPIKTTLSISVLRVIRDALRACLLAARRESVLEFPSASRLPHLHALVVLTAIVSRAAFSKTRRGGGREVDGDP